MRDHVKASTRELHDSGAWGDHTRGRLAQNNTEPSRRNQLGCREDEFSSSPVRTCVLSRPGKPQKKEAAERSEFFRSPGVAERCAGE